MASKAKQSMTPEEVRHLARLAQLQLSEEEVQRLARDLAGILDWIAMLDELPLDKDKKTAPPPKEGAPLREDAPQPVPERADLLRNAPSVEGPYFSVPKIVE